VILIKLLDFEVFRKSDVYFFVDFLLSLLFGTENGSSVFLRNVGKFLPVCMTLYPRKIILPMVTAVRTSYPTDCAFMTLVIYNSVCIAPVIG
jgi:hypothetical protein